MQLPDNPFFNTDYRKKSQSIFSQVRYTTGAACIPGGFLLLDNTPFNLLNGDQFNLLSTCPPAPPFNLLDGNGFSLLDGTPLVLL